MGRCIGAGWQSRAWSRRFRLSSEVHSEAWWSPGILVGASLAEQERPRRGRRWEAETAARCSHRDPLAGGGKPGEDGARVPPGQRCEAHLALAPRGSHEGQHPPQPRRLLALRARGRGACKSWQRLEPRGAQAQPAVGGIGLQKQAVGGDGAQLKGGGGAGEAMS